MATQPTTPPKAHTIVWAFSVHSQHQVPFEATYGLTGDWAKLFARQVGYQYTRLYRDLSHQDDGLLHYLCKNVWDTKASHGKFLAQRREDYLALDVRRTTTHLN